jgi:DNA-binding transcriptional LysR family regulator
MKFAATPSLEHLLVLLAVVETGSLTAAAKRLGRATSAISYAIDTLEDQLGISLFDRGTTRKPKLTQQGKAIVSAAKSVAYSVETLRTRVRGFLDGLEPEVSLVVDSIYPNDRLVTVFKDFHETFPTVPLRISVQALEGVERIVRNNNGWIGVGGLVHMDGAGLQRIEIGAVRIIAVANPNHPLAQAGHASGLHPRDHLQLVLSDQPVPEGRDWGVLSPANWRVGDLTLKHKLLVAGVGWGGMPEPMVRAALKSGALIQLDLRDWRGVEYPMQVVYKTETPPGPAGRWLIERLMLSSPADRQAIVERRERSGRRDISTRASEPREMRRRRS